MESEPCEDLGANDLHSFGLDSGDDTGNDLINSKVLLDHDIPSPMPDDMPSLSMDTAELDSASEYAPWKSKEVISEIVFSCSEIDFNVGIYHVCDSSLSVFCTLSSTTRIVLLDGQLARNRVSPIHILLKLEQIQS